MPTRFRKNFWTLGFVILGLVLLGLLASSSGLWASPPQNGTPPTPPPYALFLPFISREASSQPYVYFLPVIWRGDSGTIPRLPRDAGELPSSED